MQVASDHLETIEKLAKVLQRIVASLERYSNYEILFKNNLNTQRAIGALYSDLIDLCTRVVKFHSRSSLSALNPRSHSRAYADTSMQLVYLCRSTKSSKMYRTTSLITAPRLTGLPMPPILKKPRKHEEWKIQHDQVSLVVDLLHLSLLR